MEFYCCVCGQRIGGNYIWTIGTGKHIYRWHFDCDKDYPSSIPPNIILGEE